MTSRRILGSLCAFGLAMLAAPASAQDCTSDADCDPGFACKSFGTVDCGFACPDGKACPDMPPDCMPMDVKGCAPAPCTSDADCPADMVCWEQTYSECPPVSQIDCPPGSDCPQPEPAPCTDTTESTCAPKYVPPCTQDADCGPGFKCVEAVIGECSAGGASGSAGGAAGSGAEPPPPPPSEPMCTSMPTGEFYCELQETPCTSAGDCPDGFTCDANPESVVCSAPSEPSGVAGSSGGSAGAAGGAEPVDPCAGASTEPDMVCLPPYWNTGFGGGPGGVTALEAGAPAGAVDDGSTTGAGATEAPGAEPAPEAPAGSMSMTHANGGTGGGGFCAVAHAGAHDRAGLGGFAGLAALLALSLLAVRRRRTA